MLEGLTTRLIERERLLERRHGPNRHPSHRSWRRPWRSTSTLHSAIHVLGPCRHSNKDWWRYDSVKAFGGFWKSQTTSIYGYEWPSNIILWRITLRDIQWTDYQDLSVLALRSYQTDGRTDGRTDRCTCGHIDKKTYSHYNLYSRHDFSFMIKNLWNFSEKQDMFEKVVTRATNCCF